MASASTFLFTPTLPVIGGPMQFEIFDVSLTSPTAANPDWVLVIDTNYGTAIPGTTAVVPQVTYREEGVPLGMSDLLIYWNGGYYGIVITAHDGYLPGDLYQASGFQTSGDVIANASPRPTVPVLLQPGGATLGVGALSGAATGDGVTSALYEITDEFTAPTDFLAGNGVFDLYASSYVCANGLIIGSGGDIQPPPGTTPETSSLLQCLTALSLIGCKLARLKMKRRAAGGDTA